MTEQRTRYMPALDGLRAAAVIAVLLYHGEVSWARGGFLGVDLFFVLSGFLITGLLFGEWRATGRIKLSAFWARRARRLLPALLLVLGFVALYAAVWAPDDVLHRLRSDFGGTLGYVANWQLVVSGQSYFDQFATPSPLRHVWSLAIEEQFYLLWPLVFLGLLRVTRASRRLLVPITLALASASGILTVVLFSRGADASRVYYGTDTRAQALLVGAALALLLAGRRDSGRARTPWVLHAFGLVAAVVLGWSWVTTSDSSPALYRGGLAATACLAAVVIASVTHRRPGPLGALLSVRSLRWIGTISYGLYLWHWPVYVALDPARTGLDGSSLLALRLAITFVLATLSYYLVESPIRRGALPGWRVRALAPAAAGSVAVAVVLVTANLAPNPLGAAAGAQVGTAPALTHPAPPPPPRAVKGMLVGDSVGFTLGVGLDEMQSPTLSVQDGAVLGCGVIRGDFLIAGKWNRDAPECSGWLERWRDRVVSEQDDVVVALWAMWDLFDRRVDGQVLRWGTPEMDRYLLAGLDGAVTTLTSTGARLVLLTSPYYEPADLATRSDRLGTAFEKSRVDHWNALLAAVAQAHPGAVSLVDLHAYMSPGGQSVNTIDGVDDVRPDGIHFSPEGAGVVARWLEPQIVRFANGSTG